MPFLTGAPGKGGVKIPGSRGATSTTPPKWARSPGGAAKFAQQNTVKAPAGPFRSQSSSPKVNPAISQRAEGRQRQLVSNYISKLYSPKAMPGLSLPKISGGLEKAKGELNSLRDRLLNHPMVTSANAEGKVVPLKGLSKIDTLQKQTAAIEGPKGVAHSKLFGLEPRSLRVGTAGEKALTRREPMEGSVGHTLALARDKAQQRSEPSTVEDLAYASMGIPGVGVGGDIAKLAEAAGSTVPKLLAEGGAKQVASEIGVKAAAKAASVKGGIQALAHAPGEAADALRALPEALRGAPNALRGAVKAAPGAAKGAARALPGAAARGAVRSAESGTHAISGVGALAATQRAGIHTPVGQAASAFLTGTGRALTKHPGETLQTTARVIPSFITGPADLGIAAGQSAVEGSTKPFTSTAASLGKGTLGMFEHLASGNPQTVEKAVRQEVGLSPFVPLQALLAKLHGSDLYAAPRGAVRGAVEGRRVVGRAGKVGKEAAAEGMRFHAGKEVKGPIPVSARPGENYVFRGLGSKLEAGKARRGVALDTTRADTYGGTHAQLETNRILAAAHGKTGAPHLAKQMGREYEAAMAPMAKMGIPHSAEGHALMQQLADYYGKPKGTTVPGSLTDRMAANAAAAHPELFTNAKHAAMTAEFKAGSERLAGISSHASERARRIAQNDFTNHLRAKEGLAPVLKPEEMVTAKAQSFLPRKPGGAPWNRSEAWAHYKEMNTTAERLRNEGKYEARNAVVSQKKALYGELKQFTNPEHKLDTSKLRGWNKAMVRDFAKQQDAVAKGYGLEKPAAYLADKAPLGPSAKGAVVERPFSARATHIKTGELAKSGEASARFEDVLHHSVVSPRTRIAYNELVHNTLNEGKVPVKVGEGLKHVLTEAELKTAQDTHNWPANTTAVPIGVIKQALTGEHALTHEGVTNFVSALAKGGQDGAVKAMESLPADLKDEVMARVGEKGTKYAAINSAKLDELVNQFGSAKHPNWRKAPNVPTRLILNDPAWVFAQVFAKGIPIASALGPGALLRAPKAIKAMVDIQKMNPESQARIMSMVGSSAGVLGTPTSAFAPRDPYTSARAISRSGPGKIVWKLAKGDVMGKWDRWNAAKMREFAATVRADKGFRNWYGGVKGMDKGMRQVNAATKGMSAAERLDYVSKHPEMARTLQRNINQIGGNWNSFTAMERKVAPFAIFYPWIRYSLDWTFHLFPVNHPVAATALAFLAQQNSNDLQRIASEAPGAAGKGITPQTPLANPLEYSFPVTHSGGKSQVFPIGPRISPGLGVVGQIVTSGKLSNIIGGLNPLLGTGISLATGTDTFTGSKLKGGVPENLANQLLSLSPGVRAAEKVTGFRGFGKGPQSALSKAFEQTNPGKVSRSVLWPYTPQSSRNFGLQNALSKAEETIANTSHSARSEVQGDETMTVQARQKKVAKMAEEEKAAIAQKEAILKEISPATAKQAAAEYGRYKEAGKSSGGLFNSGLFGSGSSSPFKSGNLFGSSLFGGKSASKYKPPSEGIHLPGLPNIGGLIPNFLSSLIGGTKAQAAGLPKGQKPQRSPVSISGPLTPSQKAFGEELARQTGLSPKTIGGWMLAEESGSAAQSKQAKGDANWLNIGPGQNLGSNPRAAAQKTAQLINTSGYYGGIRASRGKGVGAQVSAIKASPWDGGHYANGIPTNLVSGSSRIPKQIVTRFHAGAEAARELAQAHVPYVWGGGHGSPTSSPTGGGLDCSGAVSYVLNKMGVMKGSLSSGEMGKVLKPGPGAVTVFYNGGHTFMKIGNHYFGTSVNNSSKGLAFYGSPGASYLSQFSVGHVPGLGKKVATEMGISLTGSQSFPGMSLSSSGTSATINSGAGATVSTPGFSNKPIKFTPMQRLKMVEQIASGNLSRFGIPSFGNSAKATSGTPSIASLGRSLSTQRKAMARL
jgi:hypothetical protein